MWRVGDVCYRTFKTLRFSLLSRPCQAQTATESQQRPLGSVLSGNSILLAANREEEGGRRMSPDVMFMERQERAGRCGCQVKP